MDDSTTLSVPSADSTKDAFNDTQSYEEAVKMCAKKDNPRPRPTTDPSEESDPDENKSLSGEEYEVAWKAHAKIDKPPSQKSHQRTSESTTHVEPEPPPRKSLWKSDSTTRLEPEAPPRKSVRISESTTRLEPEAPPRKSMRRSESVTQLEPEAPTRKSMIPLELSARPDQELRPPPQNTKNLEATTRVKRKPVAPLRKSTWKLKSTPQDLTLISDEEGSSEEILQSTPKTTGFKRKTFGEEMMTPMPHLGAQYLPTPLPTGPRNVVATQVRVEKMQQEQPIKQKRSHSPKLPTKKSVTDRFMQDLSPDTSVDKTPTTGPVIRTSFRRPTLSQPQLSQNLNPSELYGTIVQSSTNTSTVANTNSRSSNTKQAEVNGKTGFSSSRQHSKAALDKISVPHSLHHISSPSQITLTPRPPPNTRVPTPPQTTHAPSPPQDVFAASPLQNSSAPISPQTGPASSPPQAQTTHAPSPPQTHPPPPPEAMSDASPPQTTSTLFPPQSTSAPFPPQTTSVPPPPQTTSAPSLPQTTFASSSIQEQTTPAPPPQTSSFGSFPPHNLSVASPLQATRAPSPPQTQPSRAPAPPHPPVSPAPITFSIPRRTGLRSRIPKKTFHTKYGQSIRASSQRQTIHSVSPPQGRRTRSPPQGRRTPSPLQGRQTPSPPQERRTPSAPQDRRTPSPPQDRRTPSPPQGRGTPSPPTGSTPSPPLATSDASQVQAAHTPSPSPTGRDRVRQTPSNTEIRETRAPKPPPTLSSPPEPTDGTRAPEKLADATTRTRRFPSTPLHLGDDVEERPKKMSKEMLFSNKNLISKRLLQSHFVLMGKPMSNQQINDMHAAFNNYAEKFLDKLSTNAKLPHGVFTFKELEEALKAEGLIGDQHLELYLHFHDVLTAEHYKKIKGLLVPNNGEDDTFVNNAI